MGTDEQLIINYLVDLKETGGPEMNLPFRVALRG